MKQVFCALICSFIVSSNALAAEGKRVVVNAVSQERAQQQVQAVGSTEAIRSVVLYPAVGDRVTGVYFQPGDEVQAGDLLLELDSRLQSAALQEAQIQLADAERTLKRLEDSFAKGAIPKSERDDALTQRDLAKVALQVAKAELQDRQVRAQWCNGLTDVVGDPSPSKPRLRVLMISVRCTSTLKPQKRLCLCCAVVPVSPGAYTRKTAQRRYRL